MFRTIRSKIIIIALLMLFTLSTLFCMFTFIYLKSSKNLILDSYFHSIAVFANDINSEIIKIEDNARDLALQGEMFYKIDKNKKIATATIIRLFENYENSLGGGIWFKPYSISPKKQLYCIYVYRNKQNKVVPDNEFESIKYNYPRKSWYTDIFPKLKDDNDVVWSLPYYEKEGSNSLMVTAGYGIFYKNKLVGLSTVDWALDSIIESVSKIKPTKNTFSLFADQENDCIIATNDPNLENNSLLGKSLKTIPWYKEDLKKITFFKYKNKKYIPFVKTLDNGMLLIVCIPKNELFAILYKHVLLLFLGLISIGFIISALLYSVLKKYINKPIDKLIQIANLIGNGNLDTKIKIEKPEEFAKLASTFNKMTEDIKNITKEKERINSELALAKAIQESTLPNVFPPFPDNTEFDIYAGMEPAKEVGGDFYDFYFIDKTHLMFLIADVSGKGVPAALFMMTAKTIINNVAQLGYSPQEMIKIINQKICANNKKDFFVTVLVGIVDTESGHLIFINCGHNPPLIKKADNSAEYIKLDSNIVMGIFDEFDFTTNELNLNSGDTIIMYTDGITEAMNADENLYGEERLLNIVTEINNFDLKTLHSELKKSVKEFTQNVPQSDDMTMLTLKYNGKSANKEVYKNKAQKETYEDYLAWFQNVCKKLNISPNLQYKLDLISEELYTNISSYAYPDNDGTLEITFKKDGDSVTMQFIDNGIQFNPLEKPDPNTTDFPPDRAVGGFGIFIVKNYAEKIEYEYKDNKNILTVKVR